MCMLTAIYPKGELNYTEQAVLRLLFAELLAENGKGNRDGVGFGSYGGLVKWKSSAPDVIATKEFTEHLKDSKFPLMGHVRAISTGINSTEGAHPFLVGKTMLAHNGTFSNYQTFVSKHDVKDIDPIDSHIFTYELEAKRGTDILSPKHIKDTIEEFTGSYALIIVDFMKEDGFWIVRGGNNLFLCDVGPAWVVNTSTITLSSVLKRVKAHAEYFGVELEGGEPAEIDPYTINVLNEKGLEKVEELPKKVYPVTYYKPGPDGWVKSTVDDDNDWLDYAKFYCRMKEFNLTNSDLNYGFKDLFGTVEWYLADLDELDKFYNGLVALDTKYESCRDLYEELRFYLPYLLDNDKLLYPWWLNTKEVLEAEIATLKELCDDSLS